MVERMNCKQVRINSRIINHLGKDLITTSEVAVVELIKNSIDAHAKCINISLFENYLYLKKGNNFIAPLLEDIFEFVQQEYLNMPILLIEDDGKGMNNEQLEKGFLEIGTDIKLSDTEGITLGEKGIGRLAAQRLGRALLVETASYSEEHASLIFIDWERIVNYHTHNGNTEYLVPYKKIKKTKSNYTRLWMFGANIEDFIDAHPQLELDIEQNNNVFLNNNLKPALNFLISPFSKEKSKLSLNMYFNNRSINIDFPIHMLNLAESKHSFEVVVEDEELKLNYSVQLKPWFIERIHRTIVKAEAFKRLRKPHTYYKELLEDNRSRIENVLYNAITEDNLINLAAEVYNDLYSVSIKDDKKREEYSFSKAQEFVLELKKIMPIRGELYTFKQDNAIGQNIIIDTVQEMFKDTQYSLKKLKSFLRDYNGIKLYRNIYRIGFLGDKENDWIKLQQFRTKGQQWYRFDLGNTLGFVSIDDPKQKNIQEISSRLDIRQNKVSEAFKQLIDIVFNKLFYDLNRKANSIVKVIIEENGLIGESLYSRVNRNKLSIKKEVKRNTKVIKSLQVVKDRLEKDVKVEGEVALLPLSTYSMVETVFKETSEHLIRGDQTHAQVVSFLKEADEQLKAIEIEAYNNYKLMANGLITETITHELHSISSTKLEKDMDMHFERLKFYFLEKDSIPIYNSYVYPIKEYYGIILNKLNDVGDLYSFLENTFIKKGAYDEFVNQKIEDVINDVRENLLKTTRNNDIEIESKTQGLIWTVPKGALIHVFYNLISNSLYWIDRRRKLTRTDNFYDYNKKDKIVIEVTEESDIVVYDTGTGIMKPMEDILFEPLESGKPTGEGRGMGLYIVRQLLRSFAADIELMEDTNLYGNKYKFKIKLRRGND